MIPPPRVVPNFNGPPNKNTLVTGVVITCAALLTLSVYIRLYVRIFSGKRDML